MKLLVGEVQRAKSKHWRGFQRGAFGYNEGPTKQLPYILLEGASVIGRAFFLFVQRKSESSQVIGFESCVAPPSPTLHRAAALDASREPASR
jgi:hypothetical protein